MIRRIREALNLAAAVAVGVVVAVALAMAVVVGIAWLAGGTLPGWGAARPDREVRRSLPSKPGAHLAPLSGWPDDTMVTLPDGEEVRLGDLRAEGRAAPVAEGVDP